MDTIAPKNYSYSVVLTPEEGGGYSVTVPALPEAITCGDTIEEALAYARDCIELCIHMRLEEGLEIPQEVGPIATSIVTTNLPNPHYAKTA